MQSHQNNHLEIQRLRAASAQLDAQIKQTLVELVATRKEMLSTTTTAFPRLPGSSGGPWSSRTGRGGVVGGDVPQYPFAYDELLSFARRISRWTLPPPGVINGVPFMLDEEDAAVPLPLQDAAVVANGLANGGLASQQSELLPSQASTAAHTAATSLPDGLAAHLNPSAAAPGGVFFPWPREDQIRGGALAANEYLARERGIDPRGYDPAAEAAEGTEEAKRRAEEEKEELERRSREERERQEQAEADRRRKMADERDRELTESARRASVFQAGAAPDGGAQVQTPQSAGGAASSVDQKKQFQFMVGDLDDDEEE